MKTAQGLAQNMVLVGGGRSRRFSCWSTRSRPGEVDQGDLRRGGEAHPRQIALQCCDLTGPGDRADIAVRANQHPLAGQQAVGIFEVSAIIDQLAMRADDTDAQPRPWRENGTVAFVADQCPMRTLKQRKQAGRRSTRAAHWRIWRAVTGLKAVALARLKR